VTRDICGIMEILIRRADWLFQGSSLRTEKRTTFLYFHDKLRYMSEYDTIHVNRGDKNLMTDIRKPGALNKNCTVYPQQHNNVRSCTSYANNFNIPITEKLS
jgi:hypothetical protein